MSLLIKHKGPQAGDRRFNCECGWTGPIDHDRGSEAMAYHWAQAHDLRMEQFQGGRWWYTGEYPSLAKLVMERLRQRGESVAAFIKRINEATEARRQEMDALGIAPRETIEVEP